MISIRGLLRQSILYTLCTILIVVSTGQIESHRPNDCCPEDQSAESGNTFCYECNTPHYGIVNGHDHNAAPPEAAPTIDATACTSSINATLDIDLDIENIDEAELGDEYDGTASGATETKTVQDDEGNPYVHIEVEVVEGTNFIGGVLSAARGFISGDVAVGAETVVKKTRKEEMYIWDIFSPRSESKAWCRAWVSGPTSNEVTVSDSSYAKYNKSKMGSGNLLLSSSMPCDNASSF